MSDDEEALPKASVEKEAEGRGTGLAFCSVMSDDEEALPKASVEKEADASTTDDCAQPSLLSAVKTGDVNRVRLLLEHGANLSEDSCDRETVLVSAVKANNKEVLQVVLEHGAQANGRDECGKPVLFTAVQSGNETIVQCLLDHGADANKRGDSNTSALHLAVKAGDDKIVRLLLQHGADPDFGKLNEAPPSNTIGVPIWRWNESPICVAVVAGNKDIVQVLLEHGANSSGLDQTMAHVFSAICNANQTLVSPLPEHFAYRDEEDLYSIIPLVYANICGNQNLVQLLQEHGVGIYSGIEGQQEEDHYSMSPLVYAIKSGDENLVQLLLEHGAGIYSGIEGQHDLFTAVETGDDKMVQLLLEHGADPDVYNRKRHPVIFSAFCTGNYKMVQLLLEHGACPDPDCGPYVDSVLSCAIDEANNRLVELLLLYGASPNTDELFRAAKYGDLHLVKLLLEYGAAIDSSFIYEDEFDRSALFPALKKGDEGMVRFLLEHGADPNAYGEDEDSPLSIAVEQENYTFVELLLEKGARADDMDRLDRPLLSVAISKGNYEIAEVLLFFGADPNSCQGEYGTPTLNVAVNTGMEKFVQLLLDHGANPKYYARRDNALVCAVETSNIEIVETLLKHVNDGSATLALFSAVETGERAGNDKIVELLIENGADVKAVNENRETTLVPAIKSGNETLVQLLLEKGADLSIPDKNEETALFHAVRSGNDKALKVLLRNGASVSARNVKGETALFHALGDKNKGEDPDRRIIALMELLVSHGTDVNAKGNDGHTVLRHFLRQANSLSTEPIKFLIDSGADMSARTGTGESALHVLLQQYYSSLDILAFYAPESCLDFVKTKHEVVTLLVKDSCYSLAKARDNHGTSTLHVWAANSHYRDWPGNWPRKSGEIQLAMASIAQELIDSGAVVNALNDQHEAPLHVSDTWNAAAVLLTNKAHPNQQDQHGVIPLLSWAKSDKLFKKDAFGNWRTILEAGMDPWIADHFGNTLLSIILSKGKFQEAGALVHAVKEKQPGDISKVHTDGNTFLHIACSCESDEVQELIDQLLQAGANPNIQNANKETGLHIACIKAVRMSSSTSEEETLSSVHFWAINRLIKHGADTSILNVDGQSCLDITSDSPNLQKALKEPVDLLKIPALLPWFQQSERHKKKLAQITRSQRSERAARYQYHTDPIGLGGFSNIYVGVDTSDGREVAIKRIERRRMCSPVDKREVETLVKLRDCEEIVKYLCWFEDDSREHVYIVLELMEGNLEECMEVKTMDSSSYGVLCKYVVTGLDFLHENEILHRDIKPSNILYKTSPRLCLKIADFGLSTKGSLNAASTTTVMHTNAGTRCWMAPELLRDTTPEHSKESDVFACGLVLHFILSDRKHPFAPADASEKGPLLVQHEIVDKIIQNKPSLSKDLSPESSHLVKLMIQDDKCERMKASEALKHVLFWSNNKRVKFICAVGNQPEFERPLKFASSQVINDLKRTLGSIFSSQPWDSEIASVYSEMISAMRGRGYCTSSAADLVRFVRNCYAHASDRNRSTPMKKLLFEDFIFFDKFPTLLMDVYHAVLKDKWEHNREEIKYSISEQ